MGDPSVDDPFKAFGSSNALATQRPNSATRRQAALQKNPGALKYPTLRNSVECFLDTLESLMIRRQRLHVNCDEGSMVDPTVSSVRGGGNNQAVVITPTPFPGDSAVDDVVHDARKKLKTLVDEVLGAATEGWLRELPEAPEAAEEVAIQNRRQRRRSSVARRCSSTGRRGSTSTRVSPADAANCNLEDLMDNIMCRRLRALKGQIEVEISEVSDILLVMERHRLLLFSLLSENLQSLRSSLFRWKTRVYFDEWDKEALMGLVERRLVSNTGEGRGNADDDDLPPLTTTELTEQLPDLLTRRRDVSRQELASGFVARVADLVDGDATMELAGAELPVLEHLLNDVVIVQRGVAHRLASADNNFVDVAASQCSALLVDTELRCMFTSLVGHVSQRIGQLDRLSSQTFGDFSPLFYDFVDGCQDLILRHGVMTDALRPTLTGEDLLSGVQKAKRLLLVAAGEAHRQQATESTESPSSSANDGGDTVATSPPAVDKMRLISGFINSDSTAIAAHASDSRLKLAATSKNDGSVEQPLGNDEMEGPEEHLCEALGMVEHYLSMCRWTDNTMFWTVLRQQLEGMVFVAERQLESLAVEKDLCFGVADNTTGLPRSPTNNAGVTLLVTEASRFNESSVSRLVDDEYGMAVLAAEEGLKKFYSRAVKFLRAYGVVYPALNCDASNVSKRRVVIMEREDGTCEEDDCDDGADDMDSPSSSDSDDAELKGLESEEKILREFRRLVKVGYDLCSDVTVMLMAAEDAARAEAQKTGGNILSGGFLSFASQSSLVQSSTSLIPAP